MTTYPGMVLVGTMTTGGNITNNWQGITVLWALLGWNGILNIIGKMGEDDTLVHNKPICICIHCMFSDGTCRVTGAISFLTYSTEGWYWITEPHTVED
jgi:hypothetical protein